MCPPRGCGWLKKNASCLLGREEREKKKNQRTVVSAASASSSSEKNGGYCVFCVVKARRVGSRFRGTRSRTPSTEQRQATRRLPLPCRRRRHQAQEEEGLELLPR